MTEIILRDKTQYTPFIYFNGLEGIFEVTGQLIIDDDALFFDFVVPLVVYLEKYRQQPQAKSIFIFKIEYLNIKSNIFFYDIMKKIYELKNLTELKIIWYYSDDSEEELGYSFQEYYIDMPFEFIKS